MAGALVVTGGARRDKVRFVVRTSVSDRHEMVHVETIMAGISPPKRCVTPMASTAARLENPERLLRAVRALVWSRAFSLWNGAAQQIGIPAALALLAQKFRPIPVANHPAGQDNAFLDAEDIRLKKFPQAALYGGVIGAHQCR
jgi:hypothetical protein